MKSMTQSPRLCGGFKFASVLFPRQFSGAALFSMEEERHAHPPGQTDNLLAEKQKAEQERIKSMSKMDVFQEKTKLIEDSFGFTEVIALTEKHGTPATLVRGTCYATSFAVIYFSLIYPGSELYLLRKLPFVAGWSWVDWLDSSVIPLRIWNASWALFWNEMTDPFRQNGVAALIKQVVQVFPGKAAENKPKKVDFYDDDKGS
eukprot:CAMPEP_0175175000 /NCGR_PEP_ID=MMETSP0087-20121206/32961_1 /TAXON_ID=136419 /ORGANISM="Unknown Unknown, Strain D1" /LENGTH=202 /DNA_ID=CAMNT_0016466565 /DNA_START=1 /DNA_END=610 /DNA_ORIENTATION=-